MKKACLKYLEYIGFQKGGRCLNEEFSLCVCVCFCQFWLKVLHTNIVKQRVLFLQEFGKIRIELCA